jgi:hypothetical protein
MCVGSAQNGYKMGIPKRTKHTFDERPSIFIRDKPIFSSERMVHKDYYRRSSAEKKKSGRGSQGS